MLAVIPKMCQVDAVWAAAVSFPQSWVHTHTSGLISAVSFSLLSLTLLFLLHPPPFQLLSFFFPPFSLHLSFCSLVVGAAPLCPLSPWQQAVTSSFDRTKGHLESGLLSQRRMGTLSCFSTRPMWAYSWNEAQYITQALNLPKTPSQSRVIPQKVLCTVPLNGK